MIVEQGSCDAAVSKATDTRPALLVKSECIREAQCRRDVTEQSLLKVREVTNGRTYPVRKAPCPPIIY